MYIIRNICVVQVFYRGIILPKYLIHTVISQLNDALIQSDIKIYLILVQSYELWIELDCLVNLLTSGIQKGST